MPIDTKLLQQERPPTQAANPSSTSHSIAWGKRIGSLVLFIAIAGALLRIVLAFQLFPWTGDPSYDYSYRGLLFADGQWRAILMMWHMPGYPLLLGILAKLSGGLISTYVWGTIVSVVSYLVLVFVIDRLVAPRTRWPSTRIAVASFLALYETLFLYATGPLTEPPYVLLLFAAAWVADQERINLVRSAFLGVLFGIAWWIRLEAIAPFLGLLLFVTVRAAISPGRFREAVSVASSAIIGWLAISGWLFFYLGYWISCGKEYQSQFAIPPAQGLIGNLFRLVECAYHACTVWLPFALLLPYWVVVAIGLTHPACAEGKAPLHGLLLAIVVPSLISVATTVMVKRTASFLFPAAGVWFGLGLEVIAVRLSLERTRRGLAVLLCLAVLFNLLQASRILYNLRKSTREPCPDPATYVAAQILSKHATEVGPVWAFNSEPEIYTFWGQPLHCSTFKLEKDYIDYNSPYTQNRNNPMGFVEELRRRGFKYLIFFLSEKPDAEHPDIQETYGAGFPVKVLRSDLLALLKNCETYGLQMLGESAGNIPTGGKNCIYQVYVFRILPEQLQMD